MERKLKEHAEGLRSERAMERRRAADALKTSLHNVTRSQITKSTWEFVFNEVHDFTLKEMEKFDPNHPKANINVIVTLCDTLLNTTISNANKSKLYVNLTKILDNFFEIMRCKRLSSVLGNSYINMMIKHVLPISYYLQHVTPHQWADLLDIGIEHFEVDFLDSWKTSHFLTMILNDGLHRCHLILPIRDNLTPIEKLFTSNSCDKKQYIQENLLKIAVLILENVGVESRLATCKFAETILPHVLKFYEKTSISYKDQRKLLFKFVRLCIVIHHPCGRIYNESGSLSNDWDSWNSSLLSLHRLMVAEALVLNQNYEKNKNSQNKNVLLIDEEITNEYISFSVELCRQIFGGKVSIESRDADDFDCSKRIKLDSYDYFTLSQTLDNLPKILYPWISILNEYMKKYGQHTSSNEKVQMLTVFFDLSKSEDSMLHHDLFECIVAVYEKINICDWNSELQNLSSMIWNMALRKTSTQNSVFISCHKIIQHLLQREHFHPHLDLLIKSYSDNNMPYHDSSIDTLNILFKQYNSKVTDEKLRLKMSKWALENYSRLKSVDVLTTLLFRLCLHEDLRENHKNNSENNEESVFKYIFEDMEMFLLISDFELALLDNKTIKNDTQFVTNFFTLYSKVHTYIVKILIENLSKNISDIKTSEMFSPAIIMNLNVLLKFLNYGMIHEISECNEDFKNLKIKLLEALTIINNFFPPFYESNLNGISRKIELLNDLKCLFTNRTYNNEISDFVRDKTYKTLIELLFSFNDKDEVDNDNDDLEMDEVDAVTDYRLKTISFNIICNYCCYKSRYSDNCLEVILQSDNYNLNIIDDFNIAFEVVYFILNEFQENIPIDETLQLMQDMCKISFREDECAFKILQLLYKIMKPINATNNENAKNNCVIMLKSFLSRCNAHYYSIKTMAIALKCLSWILNQPNEYKWRCNLEDIFTETICSNIFSIRLYSCYCLHLYINSKAPEKYGPLIETLQKIFTVEDACELTSFVVSDEGANRTSTVLHFLALVALNNSVWDKHSLATILEIGVMKNIDINLMKKVFALINTFMKCYPSVVLANISFLIKFWFEKKLSIDRFPWSLTNCKSIEEFYYKYRLELIAYEGLYADETNCVRTVMDSILQTKRILREELLMECVPNFLILSLSSLKSETFNAVSFKLLINKVMRIDLTNLDDDEYNKKIDSDIGKIIHGLISNVYDTNIREFFQWNGFLPYDSKPSMTLNNFEMIMSYLKDTLKFDITKKIYIDDPIILQRLLLEIWASIDNYYTVERKLLNLYQYWIFCKILNYETNLNTFICNFIIHSLLSLVDRYKNDPKFHHVSFAACKVLHDILKSILPDLGNIISPLVPKLVKTISKYVLCNNKCGVEILDLIFDMEGIFRKTLSILDPLPDGKKFLNLNKKIEKLSSANDSLEGYIDNFLLGNLINRSEGLRVLQKKLIDHKEELKKLFSNLIDFKDSANSKLHKLTSTLIKISSNKDDEESSVLAANCLGIIGSSNYNTLTLEMPLDNVMFVEDPEKCFTYIFFNEIQNLIFDTDPNVIRATTKALISLLSYRNGKEVLDSFNNPIMSEMMLPFRDKNKLPAAKFQILSPMFKTYLNLPEIWYDFDFKNHEEWITNLVISALNSFFNTQCFLLDFIDICQIKPILAEKCFSPLIGVILYVGNNEQVSAIINFIQKYFNRYYEMTFKSGEYDETDVTDNSSISKRRIFPKASVKCMLQLVQFIRFQMECYKWEDFGFNYLPIAWAAYSTGSYFMSVLFSELWCNNLNDNIPPINPDSILSHANSENILSILRKSYEKIGDVDAIQGCGLSHLTNLSARRKHYMTSGHFMDAFLSYDLLLSSKKLPNFGFNDLNNTDTFNTDKSKDYITTSTRNFAQCLHSSGLYHLSNRYMQSFGNDTQFDDIKLDCFWRLGDWSQQVDSSLLRSNATNDRIWPTHHYICLKNALSRNIDAKDIAFSSSLKLAKISTVADCDQYLTESCQFIYDLMEKLQILQEIEDYVDMSSDYGNLISRWSISNILPFNQFKNIEPVLSQRICIFMNMIKQSTENSEKFSILETLLTYTEFALQNNALQTCHRWINMAYQILENVNAEYGDETENKALVKLKGMLILCEGKIAWKNGQKDIAFHLVKKLTLNENVQDKQIYSDGLLQLGSWMVETRSESANEILDNYLIKSLTTSENETSSKRLDAYMTIAKFADAEYKQIDSYINSPEFFNQKKCLEKCKDTAETLKDREVNFLTKEERKAMVITERQRIMDEVEIKNVKSEREQYLQLALNYYLTSLTEGDKNDVCSVFRIISLWLNNPTLDFVYEKSLVDFFKRIPSWKFLILIPQIAPRLDSSKKDVFQRTLYDLICRCATEHPHHVLPILMALKNSNKDGKTVNKQIRKKPNSESEEGYVIATRGILHSLSLSNKSSLKKYIDEMENLSTAMISLANYKVENSKKLQHNIPQSEPIKTLSKLSNIAVPTITLPIDKTGNYTNITSVVRFNMEFMLVGGINAPKKISCLGSNGEMYNMLLKGEDDIRQDAVIQQVFGIVNDLLANDINTKEKHLIIRTYKVLPLSRKSGIIEWCNGTEPFGKLLVGVDGSSGYHARFRPNDMPARDARNLLGSAMKFSNDKKLEVFKSILAKFKPVFHHFFTDKFLTPAIWYEKRLAYMNSVATSSMTGYILGLGDRHVQNILIDLSTAEVIHIDFGIAFEYGRLQPTPETVPFRLTQDMVAGFGCTGLEGVFKKSCEKIMDVLKLNQETLLTILEVLLFDPLHIWTISKDPNDRGQNSLSSSLSSIPSNSTIDNSPDVSGSEAKRALIRVRNKLNGMEFGRMLATSGQVVRLIQQAMDIKNLSRLFSGWQPYL